ncbi:hypothetical protein L873DRAFT_1798491, partial [Choiromyces venosus 120613-1]
TTLSSLTETKVPPHENKSCKRAERKWRTYFQTFKTMCERARRMFKASENVW